MDIWSEGVECTSKVREQYEIMIVFDKLTASSQLLNKQPPFGNAPYNVGTHGFETI